MMDKFIRFLKWLVAFFAASAGEQDKQAIAAGDFTQTFIGEQLVTYTKVSGALNGLVSSVGGKAVTEAFVFIKTYRAAIFSLSKNEFDHLFSHILKKEGVFDEKEYAEFLSSLLDKQLVAQIEKNAKDAARTAQIIKNKKIMTTALKHNLSALGRFALAKAISIASQGLL